MRFSVFGRAALGRRWTRLADRTLNALRRTNRGVFADSVPVVLYALHIRALERDGQPELARALAEARCRRCGMPPRSRCSGVCSPASPSLLPGMRKRGKR